MKRNLAARGTSRYVSGKVERFDQKNEMFCRSRWDPSQGELRQKLWVPEEPREDSPGFAPRDYALEDAAWYLPIEFTGGNHAANMGLYSWNTKLWGVYGKPKGGTLAIDDPARMSQTIKKIAKLLGASLVGITELDRRWLYSHQWDLHNGEYTPIEIPEAYKYAIVLAYEMNYEVMRMSPARTHGFAVGLGYTRMAMVGPILAQFIRLIGYKAIPMGNDTANSIPLAIDAGLGEIGRLGLLITPQYGPRVRLSKVFTNLPLVPDEPIEFGAWDFCIRCNKCAHNCPGQAISSGEPTDQPNNISNRAGIMRWPLNAEKCLAWFARVGGDCSNCIRVCPFNKLPGILHDSVRWGVRHTRFLDPLFIRADNLLGYGRRVSAATFWD